MPSVSKEKLQHVANLLRDLDRYLREQVPRTPAVDALRQRIAQLFGSRLDEG